MFGGASIVAIISATVASGKSSIDSGTRRRFLASDGWKLAPSSVTDAILFSPKLCKSEMQDYQKMGYSTYITYKYHTVKKDDMSGAYITHGGDEKWGGHKT